MARKQIEELTDRLIAEEQERQDAARREIQETAQAKAEREVRELAEYEDAWAGFHDLGTHFLETRGDEAELAPIPTRRKTGLFRDRWRTDIEQVPAWEIAAGSGEETSYFKEGHLDTKWHYRFMVAADGRILLGSVSWDYRDPRPRRPGEYRALESGELPRGAAEDCGIGTATQIRHRIERLRQGSYSGPLDWA